MVRDQGLGLFPRPFVVDPTGVMSVMKTVTYLISRTDCCRPVPNDMAAPGKSQHLIGEVGSRGA